MLTPDLLWKPSASFAENSNLQAYLRWLDQKEQLRFSNYAELWQWSVDDTRHFWQTIWDYFAVISHSPFTEVHTDDPMPDTRWFPGSTLNYCEHIFRKKNNTAPAILHKSERSELSAVSWEQLAGQVAAFKLWLQRCGVKKGDRVAAFLPNIPEATVAFLASCALGAVWSSCSPDFGAASVADRFRQIEPRVLIAADGYSYGGKVFDKMAVVRELHQALPSVEQVVLVPFLNAQPDISGLPGAVLWAGIMAIDGGELQFEPLPFEHPIWILYSSGTTGIPKAITHSHGGVLLEHLRYLAFHNDVHPGERFFWYSTTGWMMWNFVQASLLAGATIVLYEGSPAFPDLHALWQLAQDAQINHFGTSAPFLVACMKQEIHPGREFDLSALRSIGSTGAPLPPEAFSWVYEQIKRDVWLCSMSGGTDVCTAFVGGCPLEPLYLGEIQCRTLGCSMYAFNEEGEVVNDEVGEMVITRPMPSMPIYFWNDPDKQRYLSSYFDMFPGIWRHGDWLKITPRNSLVIYGRSDATLNRHGVRIGTAEIYRALNHISDIRDSLIVNLELAGGRHYMPLFVVMEEGKKLSAELIDAVATILRTTYSPRHVPDEVIAVTDIPYTISGKKLEAPVKKILLGMPPGKAANPDSLRNPESLDYFVALRKKIAAMSTAS